MDFKKLLQKLKRTPEAEKEQKKSQSKQYPNRFLKFYYGNKERLLKERKSLYQKKKEKGICVRCGRNTLEGIIFCEYHQQKQAEYNKQARVKTE